MGVIIGFGIVIFILVMILQVISLKEKKQNAVNKYESQGYSFDNELKIGGCTFAIDKTREKFFIISMLPINGKHDFCLSFTDIIGFEINKNGETITKASIGAPIIGGIAFGAGGVLLGSILGNRKSKTKLKVDMVIQLNSFDNPIVRIPIITDSDIEITKANSIEALDKLCVWIKLILEKNESKKSKQEI